MSEHETEHETAHHHEKVHLRLVGPTTYAAMRFPQEDGDTLVVDRVGVEVAASAAKTLIDLAAKSGVTLEASTS